MKVLALHFLLGASVVACSAAEDPRADTASPPISCVLRGISVSPATATLHIGDTLRVTASFSDCPGPPRQHSYQWASSNPAIAVIDSLTGLAAARAEGVATIIVALAEDRTQKSAMLLQVVR